MTLAELKNNITRYPVYLKRSDWKPNQRMFVVGFADAGFVYGWINFSSDKLKKNGQWTKYKKGDWSFINE